MLDFMGKQELSANLFRLTETEAKIKNERVRGQGALENAAMAVGQNVRRAMLENSGTVPENLPLADDIKTVRGGLKKNPQRIWQAGEAKSEGRKKLTS